MNVLQVKRENWNCTARHWLEPACDESFPIHDLEAECGAGACALFNVYQDADHIASFVLRIDGGYGDREMVVVAAGGYLAYGSLYKLITPYVEEQARANGCSYLRGHTKRPGVGRLMEKAGWEQSEIVYRKEMTHGRQVIQ